MVKITKLPAGEAFGARDLQKWWFRRAVNKSGIKPEKFKEQTRTCIVYGLYDHLAKLRYIGQTQQPLEHKLAWKYWQIDKKNKQGSKLTRLETWLEYMRNFKHKVTIRSLNDHARWDAGKLACIKRARAAGDDLLNQDEDHG